MVKPRRGPTFVYIDYLWFVTNVYDRADVATETANNSRSRTPLIEGRQMRCPRCRKLHDILTYVPMQQISEFVAETNPIYKCPDCRWIFSPTAHFLEDVVE